MQNTHSRVSPEKIGNIVIFPEENSTLSPFSGGKFYLWKNHSHFSGGWGGGGGGEATL